MSEAMATLPLPSVRLLHLSQEQALAEFEVLAPFLAKGAAASLGRISLESVYEGIKAGDMMPFVVLDAEENALKAVILCEGHAYPHRRVFSIALCGGEDLENWVHLYTVMRDEVAAGMGFDQIEVVGRPGWGRALGLTPQVHTFVEEIGDGQPDAED